jgi:hypothetical protein
MTNDAPSWIPPPSNFYREIACGLRTLIPTVKFPEARDTLLMLVADYEKLAAFVETLSWRPQQRAAARHLYEERKGAGGCE